MTRYNKCSMWISVVSLVAMGFGFLEPIPATLVFVALIAWVLEMVGLLRRVARALC